MSKQNEGSFNPNQRMDDFMSRVDFDARMMLVFMFQTVFFAGFVILGLDLLFNVDAAILPGGGDFISWIVGVLLMGYSVAAYSVARATGDLDSMGSAQNSTK